MYPDVSSLGWSGLLCSAAATAPVHHTKARATVLHIAGLEALAEHQEGGGP
jgi:hypothetical protein